MVVPMFRVFILSLLLVCATRMVFAGNDTKVIYGDDNRVSVTDEQINSTVAQAVAGRVSLNRLQKTADGNYLTPFLNSLRTTNQVCAEERFANEPLLPTCTGFLVAPNILVTAGHCLVEKAEIAQNKVTSACERNAWVFGFTQTNGAVSVKFNKDQVYNCKKVIYGTYGNRISDNDQGADFAIVELDRDVVGRRPMQIRQTGAVREGEKLFLVGHPSGLPLKYATGGEVLDARAVHYFISNVDSFAGNSGSPVLNIETNVVEGILVRGKKDYIPHPDTTRSCMVVNRCDSNGNNCVSAVREDLSGEHVTRITDILRYLPLGI